MAKTLKQSARKVKPQGIISFSRQFATLLAAGIPVMEALNVILKGFEKTALYPIVQAMKQKIEQGNTLSFAFRQFPSLFDPFYCNLIEIGELTGTLDTAFVQIADHQEKIGALKRKIRSMMVYPCLILILGTSVFCYLLTTVVPTFKDLFDSFHLELPLITRILLKLSAFLQNYGLVLLLVLLFSVMGIVQLYHKNHRFKIRIQGLSFKIPIAGYLIKLSALVAFTRTFMTTQAAGIPIDSALRVISQITPNLVYAAALQQVKNRVSQGIPIHQAMSASNIFPPLLIQMIAIGESSGTLEYMLKTVTRLYEDALDTTLSGLTTLIEPIMMMLMGLGVGGLVIAIYLPIFKMGTLF